MSKYDWVVVNSAGDEWNDTITCNRARTIRLFISKTDAYDNWGNRLTKKERKSWKYHYKIGFRCRKFVKDFTCGVVK